MHAAKYDVFRFLLIGGDLRELQAVASEVGELYDFIPLVVVTQYAQGAAEFALAFSYAGLQFFLIQLVIF